MTEFQELNIGGFLISLMDTIHIKMECFDYPMKTVGHQPSRVSAKLRPHASKKS